MILPDFILPSRINQHWHYSGIDSVEHCKDKEHFKNYPYKISYHYNHRGFRDNDWPTSLNELETSIWCLGDSFTVGIGSPVEHTWPWLLQKNTNINTINVSMDGASNNWLARKAQRILEEIRPKVLIIHWSYISRREQNFESTSEKFWQKFYNDIADQSWPACDLKDMHKLPQHIIDEINHVHGGWINNVCDEDRRLWFTNCSAEEDITNTLNCVDSVQKICGSTKILHSFIPQFAPANHGKIIESNISGCVIPEFDPLDLARDGLHYDIKTSLFFVDCIAKFLG
jgi:hypothetical protein